MSATPAPAESAPALSLVLAILNERSNLPELFERLGGADLPPWEAIVVDDGSTDGSREFVRDRAARDRRFRLLVHDGRQTTVRAQCVGIDAARAPRLVVMDSDLQHPPELLPAMVRELDRGAAVVVASRYAPGGTPGRRPWSRAVISRVAELIARLLVPGAGRTTDPVSGFFAFRRDTFVPLDPGQRGFKLLLFLLVMARDRDVRDVPFRFEPRPAGRSKVMRGSGFVRYFLAEVRSARRLARRLRREHQTPRGTPAR